MSETDRPPFALTPEQRILGDQALGSGFNAWAGIRLVEIASGFARMAFIPRAEMLTPWGTLNGGVLNALIEVPAFFALLTELGPNELPVTNDIFLQHVRPLPGDCEYRLTGGILRKGKSMAWLEAAVSVGGKPCTFARITKTLTSRR
ncbi:MAG TPA: PaaI family thioesterase [Alphaproteobacteria bacterium]|nr:PaaI family thioesterase [Alphaproteobacteria bacterium]